jgi:hypothetical protein
MKHTDMIVPFTSDCRICGGSTERDAHGCKCRNRGQRKRPANQRNNGRRIWLRDPETGKRYYAGMMPGRCDTSWLLPEYEEVLGRIRFERATRYAASDREESRDYAGFIYAIQDWSGATKIGRSRDPIKRLGDANTWCPFGNYFVLRMAAFTENAAAAEREVHRRLRKFRRSGEWFVAPLQEIERTIRKVCSS